MKVRVGAKGLGLDEEGCPDENGRHPVLVSEMEIVTDATSKHWDEEEKSTASSRLMC